jgi:hypothetical protein
MGVSLADIAENELRSLHTRMVSAHGEWTATGGS